MNSLFKESLNYIFLDLIGDIFYFPVWWYTKGAKKVFLSCVREVKEIQKYLALFVWIRNIFTPMYAQYDWQGRIISFFMRLVQIILRGIFLVIWSVFYMSLFLCWLVLPFLIGWQMWRLC
ncbi:MAG: hypothetical protein V1770_05775 [bacterium]